MAGCQIDVLPGDISDIILKKKVSYSACTTLEKGKRIRDAAFF